MADSYSWASREIYTVKGFEMRALKYSLLLMMGLLVACSNRSLIPSEDIPGVDDAEGLEQSAEVYQIGVADQLQIIVWRNSELSISVPVRPDGKISVPLVGDIVAAGHTSEDLAKEITSELENYIRTPQVTVIVTSAVSAEYLSRVRVIGAVGRPMSIPYRKGMTVLDVVLLAGGVTPFASANKAKLYRVSEQGTKVYTLNLNDMLKKGDVKTNYLLKPLDIITVPERLL